MQKNKYSFLFLVLFIIGTILRLTGINYGLPYLYHPDEVRQILDTLSMAQQKSLIPTDLTYPALHKYALLVLYGAYYAIGKIIGIFSDSTQFAIKFLQDPSTLFLISRLMSVAFGMGTGLIIYKIGKTIFGHRSTLIAAAFSIFMYQLIGHSQWAIADIMVTFITTTAFIYIFLDIKFFKNKYFYIACIFIGLGISSKFQGYFLILPLFVGQIYMIHSKKYTMVSFLKRFAIGSFLLIFFSLLGNVAFFSNMPAFVNKFKQLSGVAQVGLSSVPYSDGFLGLILWFSKQIIKQEMLLGGIILLGIIYSIWRHDRYDILCIVYLFVFFFMLKDWGFRYLHLFVSAFGITAILAGRFISDMLDKEKSKALKIFVYALLVIAFGLSIWRGVDAGLSKINDDTRLLAKNWIEENIPDGSRVGIDWYEFGPPLFDNIPIVVHSPTAEKFYRNSVPPAIKEEFNKLVNADFSEKKYDIISLMYMTPEPIWPDEMPDEARKRAERMEVFRDLYSWFNFISPDAISRHKIEYVVISSYAYSHFLLDNDKRKTGLFNPYIFEDMIKCNRQVDYFDDKSLNGLLFFLNRRARNFYLGFLDGEMGAQLIKEFIPDSQNLGPVIKIYKIKT